MALKGYNQNGYKAINFLAFGDTSLQASKIKAGTVLAVLNPRLMRPKANNDPKGPTNAPNKANSG